MKQSLCALSLLVALSAGTALTTDAIGAPVKRHAAKPAATKPLLKPAAKSADEKDVDQGPYTPVESLSLLKNVDGWVGQKVTFPATFVSFSPYALDYKPAMRSSKDYVAFLVQRPDVTHHIIPLAELKLIYPRKKADKVMDLESNDKVAIKGKVFSSALGDPWIDVDEVVITQKDPKNLEKAAAKKKVIKPATK